MKLRFNMELALLATFVLVFLSPQAKTPKVSTNPNIYYALNYLNQTQVKTCNAPSKFKGEWGCYIYNRKNIPLLAKKGYTCYDSNCFITCSIHNILADIYLTDPSYDQIPGMLELSMNNILLFRNGNTFNFWHQLKLPENLQNKNEDIKRRRSNHFQYKSEYTSRLFNIHDDSDDTAAGLRAIRLYNQICRMNSLHDKQIPLPDSIGIIFSTFRDIERKHSNYYNLIKKHGHDTGAFLTWFGEERYSSFILPYKRKQNIPLGFNDVDCVVNANILLALTELNELNTDGVKSAIKWISNMIQMNKCSTCGNYYPTNFSLCYSFSKAISKGLPVSIEIKEKLLSNILNAQQDDGSWIDEIPDNNLQSTLFAVNALLNLTDNTKSEQIIAIEKGINFILSQAITEKNQTYWKGGAYFSIGSFGRKSQLWKSDEYTTALAIEAIFNYQQRFFEPNLLVEN